MSSQYDAVASRALATITKKGAAVVFPGAVAGTAPTYDPATDTWSGGTSPTDATGRAVQIPDDPARFRALGLVLANPITLLIAASGLVITPAPLMAMTWNSVAYAIQNVEPVAPDGTQIIYTVIGSA